MSNRLSREEIKHDEITDALGRTVEYVASHRQLLTRVGIGAVVLAVVAVIAGFLFSGDDVGASKALVSAVRVFDAPIDATSPKPSDPVSPSFPNEEARRTRAKELLETVRREHGGSEQAKVAGLYLGRIAASQGDLATAKKSWEDFVAGAPDHFLAAQTRLNLLRLETMQGSKEEAVKKLEGLLEKTEKPLPEDVLLFELATQREALGRADDALAAYQRIVDEFPGSPYQREAQQKVTSLSNDAA
jgi:tetratricopeptide (TPR) repeat protein